MTPTTIDKVLSPGTIDRYHVYLHVQYGPDNLNPGKPGPVLPGPVLRITGVHGPKSNGNAYGGCGQIIDTLRAIPTRGWLADGWTPVMVAELAEVWDTWHLNAMRAGTPRQTAYLRSIRGEYPGYPTNHYEWACERLAAVGLNPDSEHLVATMLPAGSDRLGSERRPVIPGEWWYSDHGATDWSGPFNSDDWDDMFPARVNVEIGRGYRYGSAWLYEPVPDAVVEFLRALPVASSKPAWV